MKVHSKKSKTYHAVRDELTGLKTRHGFIRSGNKELQKAAYWRQPITLIYVDLDDFRKFKIKHGESAANSLLAKLAKQFQKEFRKCDLLAHLHGDEFLILLPGVYPEEAVETLHRFRADLEEVLKKNDWPVTASIGAVTYLTCPSSVSMMIKIVEPVMHAVKKSGKNSLKHKIVA